jgi:hypothetical protein
MKGLWLTDAKTGEKLRVLPEAAYSSLIVYMERLEGIEYLGRGRVIIC